MKGEAPEDVLLRNMIPMRDALPHLKEVRVDDLMTKKIRNGHHPQWPIGEIENDGPEIYGRHLKLVNRDSPVAIVQARRSLEMDKGTLKLLRVFH